jgi:hypothetical protein
MRISVGTWPRLTAGVVLSLLLEGFVPSVVRASCGDYLEMKPGSRNHVVPHSTTSQPNPPTSDHWGPTNPFPTSFPFAPCSAPHCSREQQQPLVPPLPVPTSRAQEHWACVQSLLLPGGVDWVERIIDNAQQRPIRQATSIYHPPRSYSCVSR